MAKGEIPPGVPKEEEKIIEERFRKMKMQMDACVRARYKLEIILGAARSREKPYPGGIVFWLSGSALGGDGDEKVYECPRCEHLLPPKFSTAGEGFNERREPTFIAVCPECGTKTYSEDLVGERMFNLTSQFWAEAIHKAFRRVGGDADIYLKFHPEDIRAPAMVEVNKEHRGDLLRPLRNKRVPTLYPLVNIIKDTGAGADLLRQFRAFIEA